MKERMTEVCVCEQLAQGRYIDFPLACYFLSSIYSMHNISHILINTKALQTCLYTAGWCKKNGASLSHCKYSDNSMTELRENWWTSANVENSHSLFV